MVTDNKLEFNSDEFECFFWIWKSKRDEFLLTALLPAADAVVKSSHQVIGQIFRMRLHDATVKTKAELETAFNDA